MTDIKTPALHNAKATRDALRTAAKALAVKTGVPTRAGEGHLKLLKKSAVKLGGTFNHDAKEKDIYAFLVNKLIAVLP